LERWPESRGRRLQRLRTRLIVGGLLLRGSESFKVCQQGVGFSRDADQEVASTDVAYEFPLVTGVRCELRRPPRDPFD
jgi:hypothetical protein